MYAILSHGGRQYRVSAGDRLLVDRLDAEVGSVIALEPVLLTGGDGATALGEEVVGMRVAAIVVSHLRGPKLRIFKYKAKKRYRRAAGYRSDLTEVRIDSILAKGDKLPAAPAARVARTRAATPAPVTEPTTTAKASPRPKTPRATTTASTAPATSSAAPAAARAKRAPRPKAAAKKDDAGAPDAPGTKESGDGA